MKNNKTTKRMPDINRETANWLKTRATEHDIKISEYIELMVEIYRTEDFNEIEKDFIQKIKDNNEKVND